jgi:hypothetical protein
MGSNAKYFSYTKEYSLDKMVTQLEVTQFDYQKRTGFQTNFFQNLVIVDHSHVGCITVGETRVTSARLEFDCLRSVLSGKPLGLVSAFERLDQVMVDDGQIQLHECDVASFRPEEPKIPENQRNQTVGDVWNKAVEARRMLSSVAALTKTTVFASSDANEMTVKKDQQLGRFVIVADSDLCLEFGVNRVGFQMDFDTDCDLSSWDLSKWGGSLQTRWDLNKSVEVNMWGGPSVRVDTWGENPEGLRLYAMLDGCRLYLNLR